MEKVTNVPLTDGEVSIVEYALEQVVNKLQERIAEEHSGIAQFMLQSNMISAKAVLEKLKPEVEASQDEFERVEAPEA
jgi:hypothetical protein